ncbi:MAG: tRNA pseudouridine(55) synthase TruB [Desulfobacterales bacterium]|jgi:tRNA pseudouridine55 synthase
MDLDGVIVVDKPEGITSARVVSRVKKAIGARKAGHAGTLDPFATGVLVCCLNRATRLARFFLAGDKRYRAVMRLGIETDTQDATGRVTAETDPTAVTEAGVQDAVHGFRGRIRQRPPVFSALKHRGVPLYKLARRGQPVEKPPRQVEIRSIEITGLNLPEVEIDVTCSAGTYIRTLCADIGARLGCGGHLKTLRRLKSGGFSIDEAFGLDRIEDEAGSGALAEWIVPMAEALRNMPARFAEPALVGRLLQGRHIAIGDLDGPADGVFKVLDTEGRLVAILEAGAEEGRYTYCGVFGAE